jgi:hypothetical protein
LKIGIFRDVQDLLHQGVTRGTAAAGAGRKGHLVVKPDIAGVGTADVVYAPDAGNRRHFSTEKRHLPYLFEEFFWRHIFFSHG